MRKLHEAVVVAAMVGGVSMFGAGIAFAGGYGAPSASVECTQEAAESSDPTTPPSQSGDQNLAGGLSSGGDASTSANQQVCGFGNDGNTNESGSAVGGDAGDGTITVGPDAGIIDAILGAL